MNSAFYGVWKSGMMAGCTHRHLWDTYRFLGFRLTPMVRSIFGDPKACGIHLCRRGKTACGACGQAARSWYDQKTRRVRDLPCGDTRVYLEVQNRRVECTTCDKVKQETLDWLADNPFYAKRFAFFVGRRCRTMTIKDDAEETRCD